LPQFLRKPLGRPPLLLRRGTARPKPGEFLQIFPRLHGLTRLSTTLPCRQLIHARPRFLFSAATIAPPAPAGAADFSMLRLNYI